MGPVCPTDSKPFEPAYLRLARTGELLLRAAEFEALLAECRLCPRACGVDRTAGELGTCGAGHQARLASHGPHFGEEAPLVGRAGSGTVFFAHCNLLCAFCQNWEIAHTGCGQEIGPEGLAAVMLDLQDRGCHNINLVTPSHVVPAIVRAVALAARRGLHLPLVYNCGGYESLEVLALLDGVVDIYMPDFKFSDPAAAELCTSKPDYPDVAKAAIREMHRQVGDLTLNERGVAVSGLLVRHLVLPGGHAGTREVMRFLSEEISPNTCVNVMDQYFPAHLASQYPPFDRRVSREEYLEARKLAEEAGLRMVEEL